MKYKFIIETIVILIVSTACLTVLDSGDLIADTGVPDNEAITIVGDVDNLDSVSTTITITQ